MEKNLKITLEVSPNGKLTVHHDLPVTLEVLTQIYMTAQLSAMTKTVELAPDHQEEVRQSIYDMFNIAASNLLTQFDPNTELRPDLTADAIKAVEDQLLNEHWDSLSKEEQEKILEEKAKLKPKKLVQDDNA